MLLQWPTTMQFNVLLMIHGISSGQDLTENGRQEAESKKGRGGGDLCMIWELPVQGPPSLLQPLTVWSFTCLAPLDLASRA